MKHLRILFVGVERFETDSAGMFRAFRRLGHIVRLVDEEKYYPAVRFSPSLKIARRLLRPAIVKEFNRNLLREASYLKPDLCVVFKGNLVMPATLSTLKERGIFLICFYPDISYFNHGPYIPQCIPLYHHVFSTKSFHLEIVPERLGQPHISFLPHAFDPEVHRPMQVTAAEARIFGADVAFIGSWSPRKAQQLSSVARYATAHGVDLKIWGNRWENNTEPVLHNYIRFQALEGDLYPLCINCSKIMLGLLLEQVDDFPGDRITSRSFNIPGSGGFMLHARTDEILEYFQEDHEIACFGDQEELVQKIAYYLAHEEERTRIQKRGYQRALAEHKWEQRVQTILAKYLAESP